MEETNRELFEKVVKVAQARGFVFNASSIYGGLRSSYDYGPLGVLLKNNISKYWWKDIDNDSEISIFPVDTAIIQSSEVWKASGHLAEFSDPMVDHKPSGERFRVDQVPENLKNWINTKSKNIFGRSLQPARGRGAVAYSDIIKKKLYHIYSCMVQVILQNQ